MAFASEDFKTILNNHTWVASKPNIRLISEDHPSGHADNGEVVIREETRLNGEEWVFTRKEPYRVFFDILLDRSTTTTLRALFDDIQSAIDDYNTVSTSDYYISLSYSWSGNVRMGAMSLIADMKKIWVVK